MRHDCIVAYDIDNSSQTTAPQRRSMGVFIVLDVDLGDVADHPHSRNVADHPHERTSP